MTDALPPTPLELAPRTLCEAVQESLPGQLLLKREDTHELGAFKWRGAFPTVEGYRAAGVKTVVTASTGNHGAAVAWACRRIGLNAIVHGPSNCAEAKLALIRSQGAAIELGGADLDEAKDMARARAAENGYAFFEDGAETAQFAGYGSIAREILEQLDTPPAAVVVPVGNGALLIGVGRELRSVAPGVELVGVVAAEAPVMAQSVSAGRALESDRCSTFADGLAIRVAIPEAVRDLVALDCRVVEATERQLAEAVGAYARAGIRVEGAGAATLAAMPQIGPVGETVILVTGRNIDAALHDRAVSAPTTFRG